MTGISYPEGGIILVPLRQLGIPFQFLQRTRNRNAVLATASKKSDKNLPLSVLWNCQLSRYSVGHGHIVIWSLAQSLRRFQLVPFATKCLKQAGRSWHLEVVSKSDFFPLGSLRKGLEMYHWFSWNLLCRPGQLKLIKIWLALPPEFWKWRLPCWTQTWFCHSVLLYRPGCPWIQSSCISLPDGFVCYNTPGSLMFHVDKNKTNKKPDRITTLFMKM